MADVKKQKSNYILAVTIVLILAVIAGVTTTLVYNGQTDGEGALHILRMIGAGIDAFFFTVAVGMALTGIILKKKFLFIVSMMSAYFGVIITLVLCSIVWWIVLITAIAVALIVLFSSMGVYRNNVALTYSNEDPQHQTYEQFKEERKLQEEVRAYNEKEEQKEEELPEIKSFKDN